MKKFSESRKNKVFYCLVFLSLDLLEDKCTNLVKFYLCIILYFTQFFKCVIVESIVNDLIISYDIFCF